MNRIRLNEYIFYINRKCQLFIIHLFLSPSVLPETLPPDGCLEVCLYQCCHVCGKMFPWICQRLLRWQKRLLLRRRCLLRFLCRSSPLHCDSTLPSLPPLTDDPICSKSARVQHHSLESTSGFSQLTTSSVLKCAKPSCLLHFYTMQCNNTEFIPCLKVTRWGD